MQLHRGGVGYFAPAHFDIPQSPFYGQQASGMAGLGCGSCSGNQYDVGFGSAYPTAYAPGGMGTISLTSTGVSFLDNLGAYTLPTALPVLGGTTIAYAWLAVAAVGAYMVFSGGHSRRRNPRRASNPRRRLAMNRRRRHHRR